MTSVFPAASQAVSKSRQAIRDAYFADEAGVVAELLRKAAPETRARARISERAVRLVGKMRADKSPNVMESFLAEYGLSTDEGVALMCLAESYLRVPDAATLDALIKDKIGGHDWGSHSGTSGSLLVNASSWALMLTGRILGDTRDPETEVLDTMRGLVQRTGLPFVRTAVAQAMKVLGRLFVLGRSIEEALDRASKLEAKGYRYSYDMLGEAAKTEADARRYQDSYWRSIQYIGSQAKHKAVMDNPGISVKLSALHPRYEYVQRERVLHELVPRLLALASEAKRFNIGLSVDAEEADRLDLSLDVLEAVLSSSELRGWDGFGFVVQAYSKQTLPLIGWIDELATRLDRRVAVRLVKGAYWDMEIKNAQVQGLGGYPVFTRKAATDVSYLACAQRLKAAGERIFPQFATHNAQTASAILELFGGSGQFEFQRLHGMGESLHEMLRKEAGTRCRIYAPVGVHKDLLAYLVRRLLENGANSSFVHQLLDERVAAADLVQDPFAMLETAHSLVHARVPRPADIFQPERRNSKGWNIFNPVTAARLEADMQPFARASWQAQPMIGGKAVDGETQPVFNPARLDDQVGEAVLAGTGEADHALDVAAAAFAGWRDRRVEERAAILDKAADLYEENAPELMALLTREAGKTRMDGVLEVREAVDFLRYYAAEARRTLADGRHRGRGTFVCISPWNFPLAIFTGQIAAALAAGNAVIAKPAEATALIATRAVSLMHQAGVPGDVLNLLPGPGSVIGAALVADPRTAGVCFTGSTATAIRIDRGLAEKGGVRAPLIAETGGLNAMIVDSTALPEHVVRDVVASAFQSAGQRCSALRALFVQEDVAAPTLEMLEGAMHELVVGDPWAPKVDVGPVIDDAARETINAHCAGLRERGRELFSHGLDGVPENGRFVAPAAYRLDNYSELEREIFGPVLHVIRYREPDLKAVVKAINASGYGLTLGLHSRIDHRVEAICRRAHVGNMYVNRNQIGAVVGVQPFGGEGLSGTGPKAGGPHYLSRFTEPAEPRAVAAGARFAAANAAGAVAGAGSGEIAAATARARAVQEKWDRNDDRLAVVRAAIARLDGSVAEAAARALTLAAPLCAPALDLPGPTGESNRLNHHGRGVALCLGDGGAGPDAANALVVQIVAALVTGNAVVAATMDAAPMVAVLAKGLAQALPKAATTGDLLQSVSTAGLPDALTSIADLDLVVFGGGDEDRRAMRQALAARPGARVPLISLDDGPARFVVERVVSVDITASGGNAKLLTLSET